MSGTPFWRKPGAAAAIDAVLIITFAALGRASHAESNPVLGSLYTAWPFLAGATVGWLVVRSLRKAWPLEVGSGITVWFSTLVFGMLLRWLTGAGTAGPFVVVAAVALAALLLGWRLVATGLGTRSADR